MWVRRSPASTTTSSFWHSQSHISILVRRHAYTSYVQQSGGSRAGEGSFGWRSVSLSAVFSSLPTRPSRLVVSDKISPLHIGGLTQDFEVFSPCACLLIVFPLQTPRSRLADPPATQNGADRREACRMGTASNHASSMHTPGEVAILVPGSSGLIRAHQGASARIRAHRVQQRSPEPRDSPPASPPSCVEAAPLDPSAMAPVDTCIPVAYTTWGKGQVRR